MGSPLLHSHGLTRFHAPDGSEMWMDERGHAFRADCSRAPGYDGPASPAPLDRAEVARVLYGLWDEADGERRRRESQGKQRPADINAGRAGALRDVVDALGLRAEFAEAREGRAEG